ncbi:hypothetical protein FHR33_004577 [Nonomuraea dietziae]|uniref:Uncharacterized protein n=1 Tax=Nonomuraea dietziae TaxID=65515 RepID=A0A7W5VIY3_9ACTN|nr:hypothetical protein [Nonomuraea dietziae]
MAARADAHEVEGADQVDLDDLAVAGEVVRSALAVDGPLGPADARAVDDHANRLARGHGRVDGRLHVALVRYVRPDEDSAEFVGDRLAALLVEVGDDHGRALAGELAGRGLAQPAGPARDDCYCSVDVHATDPNARTE